MDEVNSLLAELISKLIKLPDREISESDLITFLYLVNLLNLINRKKYFVMRWSKLLDILKLKGKVAENNLNMTSLSKKIGMNKNTLYRKIANDGEKLNLGDIKDICKALELSFKDACTIFMNM